MRILIILNEGPMGSHPDVYEAFSNLVMMDRIEGFDVVPFEQMRRDGAEDGEIVRLILRIAPSYEAILWMHTGTLKVDEKALDALRGGGRGRKMIYWEGDAYEPWTKPIPRQMVGIMARCDRVFLPCGGPVLRTLAKAGVARVSYAPSCASETRFPHVWSSQDQESRPVVMIGNRVSSKLPFRTMRGARLREEIVEHLNRRLDIHVNIYGTGWDGAGARGACGFDEQSSVYAKGRLAVGADNTGAPLAFSNRLPIALASGIPLVHRRNQGVDRIFPEDMQWLLYGDLAELDSALERLLVASREELESIGRRNRDFFENSLITTKVAAFVVESVLGDSTGAVAERSALWMKIGSLM